MQHETWHYKSIEELNSKAAELGAFMPLSSDTSCLYRPLDLGSISVPNRIALQPMEGSDGTEKGAPGELTKRRYVRFARGGAGLIWFEAVASVPEARASLHQLMLTEENVDDFKRLLDEVREAGIKANGYAPVIVMQATNSGRYSKPTGVPQPIIAENRPPLEDTKLPESCIVSDETLDRYAAAFENSAKLSQKAGFDGMDVKFCHGYLAIELLGAFTRPGRYGGSYENRTRFIKDAYRAAKSAVSGKFFLTSRMGAYDGFAFPYGFGMSKDSLEPDFSEPIKLIGELKDEFDIPLLNITMGNPYRNPHVNRPYDHGNYVPDEHPLEGISRMMKGVSTLQHAYPELPIIGSAYSYLREYSLELAAGMVSGGHCAMAGFGRLALAYPDFPNEGKTNAVLDKSKCCVTCGACASLLRAGRNAGCCVRDREVYKL